MELRFHHQLIAARDNRHSKNHPFFDLWAQGKLTKKQTAFYCAQHFHYVVEYLNWLAYEASQIPQRDVKAYLFENLGDEENPEDRHLDMLKDYVASCDVNPDSVEGSIVLGGTDQLQNWGWRLVYQTPWQAALAGMFIGLESQFLDICKKIVPPLHKYYGHQPGARESDSSKSIFTLTKFTDRKVSPSWRNMPTRSSCRPLLSRLWKRLRSGAGAT